MSPATNSPAMSEPLSDLQDIQSGHFLPRQARSQLRPPTEPQNTSNPKGRSHMRHSSGLLLTYAGSLSTPLASITPPDHQNAATVIERKELPSTYLPRTTTSGHITQHSSENVRNPPNTHLEATKPTILQRTRSRIKDARQGRAGTFYNLALQKSGLTSSKTRRAEIAQKRQVEGIVPQMSLLACQSYEEYDHVPAKTFWLFPFLPAELQLRILQVELRKGRNVEIRYPTPPWPLDFEHVIIKKGLWARPPPLMAVCGMIREECLKFYKLSFKIQNRSGQWSKTGYPSSPTKVYFNSVFDTLVMPAALLSMNLEYLICDLADVQTLCITFYMRIGFLAVQRLYQFKSLKNPIKIAYGLSALYQRPDSTHHYRQCSC